MKPKSKHGTQEMPDYDADHYNAFQYQQKYRGAAPESHRMNDQQHYTFSDQAFQAAQRRPHQLPSMEFQGSR